MPPTLALFVWFVLLVLLLRYDPARDPGASAVLWIPIIWIFIVASRLPAQWLGYQAVNAEAAFEQGNSLDRTVLFALIVLAMGVLISRSFPWNTFVARNLALAVLLVFALLSVIWSDFPLTALKRWIRDLGTYAVVLVILSEPRPEMAVRTVLRRLSYLLIPLSIILIKYYPSLGKTYSEWTGEASYVGVATTKNMLGMICLVGGLYFIWDTLTRWSDGERRTKAILVNLVFMLMTLWLLRLSHSLTSIVCFVLGCIVLVLARSRFGNRNPAFLKMLLPTTFCLYLVLAFGFNLNGDLATFLGRDPTLTDRTRIWHFLLSMHTNVFVGTGYRSFWLGDRLRWFWQNSGLGYLNEAHNGYLEVYLELGTVGVALLAAFLISSYRNICRRMGPASTFGQLNLAIWAVLLFYNMTEGSFEGGFLWIAFLIGALTVPPAANEDTNPDVVASDDNVAEPVLELTR